MTPFEAVRLRRWFSASPFSNGESCGVRQVSGGRLTLLDHQGRTCCTLGVYVLDEILSGKSRPKVIDPWE